MAAAARWRTRVDRPVSLIDALAFLRTMDPAARLVVPAGREPVDPVLLRGITLDSGQVVPGDLFAGLPGARHHGARYTPDAARAGAVGLLSDRAHPALPSLLVERPRRVLGPLASWLHGEPSAVLDVHGVTGTNGKTSTVHLMAAGLRAAGRGVGLAGSLEMRVGDHVRGAQRTTAEAPGSCRTSWPSPVTRALPTSFWRCRATAWRSTGWAESGSGPPCSPT